MISPAELNLIRSFFDIGILKSYELDDAVSNVGEKIGLHLD